VGLCGTHPLAAEIATAVDLALSCGAAMLQTEGASASFKDAGGIDPTTATDLSNERLVLETLRKRFPAHAIISEEDAHVQGHVPPLDPSTPTWIVDPIDGTQNFCHGLPLSCVSIGLCEAGVPVLGVVYHPHTDELYVGVSRATPAEPAASYLNGRRLRAAPCESLHEALIMTCFGYERSGAGIAKMGAVVQNVLAENTFALRVIGSSVLGVCWVAAGRASGVYHGALRMPLPPPRAPPFTELMSGRPTPSTSTAARACAPARPRWARNFSASCSKSRRRR